MILLYIFILGLAVGSFLNVLIDRLPNGQSILGRSHCDYCKKTLQPRHLIPLVSYMLQKGKCQYCKRTLSWQYPGVEMLTGALFVFTWVFLPNESLEVRLLYLVVVSILIAMFFADLKYQIIPDELQIGLAVVAIRLTHVLGGLSYIDHIERLVYAFVVAIPMLVLFLVTKGRGMGFADVKLAFVLGLLFGAKLGLLVLYGAFILGGLVGIYLMISGRKNRKSKIAFGPFIVISALLVLYNMQFCTQLIARFFA